MGLKLTNGVYPLNGNGLPLENDRQEDLLQNVSLRLTMCRGSFPYDRELGSALGELDTACEHAEEQAAALAAEALMDVPAVSVLGAALLSRGRMRFTLDTPEGEESVTVTPAQPAN